MSADTQGAGPPPPVVPEGKTIQVSDRVFVIPDERIPFVPNIGIVVGDHSALVIDTAMGPANGDRVLREARRLAGDRRLFVTITHFHPEHGFGAQSFADEAILLYNAEQEEELREKGQEFIDMFKGFGPELAELLEPVELVWPQITWTGEARLDLGGTRVEFRSHPRGHTRGDQSVYLPQERILFAGDLVEHRFLPILPDPDADGDRWLEVLDELEALGAETVVGGHGRIGDRQLVADLRAYLEDVRDRTRAESGDDLDRIVERVEPEIAQRYSDWDNQEWIRSAIESFART